MRLVAAGLSHRTAPVAVRERAAIPAADGRTILRYLVGHSGLAAASVLSTCNRTEFYLMCPGDDLVAQVIPRLARYLDPAGTTGVAEHLETRTDADAVRHIFRVASGLESMLVGEAQVLGQIKAAHRIAREAGTLDARLDFVLRRAASVGKRVRTRTAIGRRAGSISEVALEHARISAGGLSGAGVLLVGAGKMSRLAAQRLVSEGAHLLVTSRGGVSAAALATELGGAMVPADDLSDVAEQVDVILCSTSSASPVLAVDDVIAMQSRRQGRRLCILDIAVPRDVEPAVADIPGVELIDLDSLGELVARNLEGRRREIPRAERIIEAEVSQTVELIGHRDTATPTIIALTSAAEGLRRREVERALRGADGIDAALSDRIDVLTRSLVRKLLHGPISHLRDAADDPAAALILRDAFDLDLGLGGEPPASTG